MAMTTTPPSAAVYVTPLITTWLAPAGMIPVSVPPSDPVPVLRQRRTCVGDVTLRVVPSAARASTTTKKPMPAIGCAPSLTDGIARAAADDAVGIPTANRAPAAS